MINPNSDKLKDLFIARDGNQLCYIDDLRSIIASELPGGLSLLFSAVPAILIRFRSSYDRQSSPRRTGDSKQSLHRPMKWYGRNCCHIGQTSLCFFDEHIMLNSFVWQDPHYWGFAKQDVDRYRQILVLIALSSIMDFIQEKSFVLFAICL